MEIETIVDELLRIRALYPTLNNDEVLKLLELKALMEIRGGII